MTHSNSESSSATAEQHQTDKDNQAFPFLAFQDASLKGYKLNRRFDRMGRLVGDHAMKRLMEAHVMIIGLGGVGSYAAEAIVRAGVGRVTIVDFDLICATNVNRQLHAMQGVIGKPKADIMAERFRKINPKATIEPQVTFYNRDSSDDLLSLEPDWIIDAIDSVTMKCHLLAQCRARGLKVISASGAAGRLDPTGVKIADLADTRIDMLARSVRKILRQKFNFPRKGSFDIPCVYSEEPATAPHDLIYDNGEGFRCVCPQGQNEFFNCDSRNLIMGNAGFVTGTFGFVCASHVVRQLIQPAAPTP